MFKNLSIRHKLWVGMSLVVAFSVLGIGIISYWTTMNILRSSVLKGLNNEVNLIYGQIQSTADASIKNYLRSVAEKDTDIVNYYYEQYTSGKLSEAQAKERAAGILLSQTIGKSGYVFVVDSHGVLQVHPKLEQHQNISQYEFAQQQAKNKYGYLEYQWKNPGEETERPKALYMNYFEPWDWIISASAYRVEFNTLVNVKEMRDSILSIKIGKTDYPYVMDTQGNLIIHPTGEGQNVYDSQDVKGNYFIRQMIDNRNGQILYPWKNPGDTKAQDKIVIYKYLPELNYIVAAGINLGDLSDLASQYNPVITGAVFISVLLALAVSVLLARSLSRPIISLKQVTEEIAGGDYSKQAQVLSRDEIGDLARAFNKMVATTQKNIEEISDQKTQIEDYNKKLEVHKEQLEDFAQHLEDMVSERTAEYEAANDELIQTKNYLLKTSNDIRRLLDNTGDGFLYFNDDLLCGNEFSAECLRLFACQDITGCNIVELLFPADQTKHSLITRILGNIFKKEPKMRSVYLSLLPNEITLYDRAVQLEYKLITPDTYTTDELTMMIILKDITEKRALEQKMKDERNILRMVVTVVGNYRDFKDLTDDYRSFCRGVEDIRKQISAHQFLNELYVNIHTFKGNFSQMYMTKISARLHDLESKLIELKQVDRLEKQQIYELLHSQKLDDWLNEDLEVIKSVLGESFLDKGSTVEIEVEKLRKIEHHVLTVFQPSESKKLMSMLCQLRYQPFRELLHSYPEYVLRLAQRLGKSINPLIIEDGDFSVDPDKYHNFVKSLVHVFRNSVDHGIESPEERIVKDKEEYGTIGCKAVLEDGYIVLTITDDGQGLDMEKIKARAVIGGICSSETASSMEFNEASQLIFTEGLSTKKDVTDLSGRGVGLKAVSNEVEALQGKINIETYLDKGTIFQFVLPHSENL